MIHKVNRPEFQLIVSSPKAAENDPGSSQGGGVAYEGPSGRSPSDSDSEKKDAPEAARAEEAGKESVGPVDEASATRQIGWGNVLREFKESHPRSRVRPGLTTQYQSEGGNSKGLLLNKKVE